MKLSSFLKGLVLITLITLSYVHMQMQIFDLAYQGKSKEKQIRYLVEENGSFVYTILALKSAQNIGTQILAENSEMKFADPSNILNPTVSIQPLDEVLVHNDVNTGSKHTTLLSLLSFSK